MKVRPKNHCISPWSINNIYECHIIKQKNPNNVEETIYYVPCPEFPQWPINNSGYCDKFTEEYFHKFFISINEERKQKLEKLNEKRNIS